MPAPTSPAARPPPDPSRGRSGLQVVTGIVALEAVALVALGLVALVEVGLSDTRDLGRALGVGGLAVVAGAGLGVAAAGLLHARSWARSPALVANLVLVPVALGLVRSPLWYVGVPLLAGAIVGVGLLFSTSVNEVMRAQERGGDGS